MRDIKEEIKKLYLELQSEAGFDIGDKVKVIGQAKSFEYGWREVWLYEKDKYVGNIFEIRHIDKWGISLKHDEDNYGYHFPYFILEKVEEQTYHVGQHFMNNGCEYILARVSGNKINLFGLSSGNRWSNSISVFNINKITEDEMKQLADRQKQWKDFKLITE